MLAKQNLKRHQHLASRPRRFGRLAPLWLCWARPLCHTIPSCHILCDHASFETYWIYAWILVHMMFFLSSDVPEMVDEQNSWNSLVISTYLLYLEWNVCMLVVNICTLWPPTLTFGHVVKHCRDHISFLNNLPDGTTLTQEIVASSVFPVTEILATENHKLYDTFLHVTLGSQSLFRTMSDLTGSDTIWTTE
jgi:hypothetical protein